tara:strand:- start:990 stop:1175 length:186 start_codon:yes stop_codon:yes gene_type:complete
MIKNFWEELKALVSKYKLIIEARWVAFKGSVKASLRVLKRHDLGSQPKAAKPKAKAKKKAK